MITQNIQQLMNNAVGSRFGRGAFLVMASALMSVSGYAADANLAKGAKVSASSHDAKFPAAKVVDGEVSDPSRWLASKGDQNPWVEIQLAKAAKVGVIDVYTGYGDTEASSDFTVSLKRKGAWVTPKGGVAKGNKEQAFRVALKQEKLDEVTAIRITFPKGDLGKVREVAIYENPNAMIGVGLKGSKTPTPKVDRNKHQIAVNQVGYSNSRPKRFTAPLSPDGTSFVLREVKGSEVLFKGTINHGLGDFSSFKGKQDGVHYVLELSGGKLKDGISDPFLIEDGLIQKQYWQAAVDFLNDGRSVIGTHPSAYGGGPWRDGTYYDAIVPSLVIFYLSDQKTIDAMPRQIDWDAERKRTLSPDFVFDAKNANSKGVMEAVRNYYKLEPPKKDAPDVVKMIHWGAGYYLVNPSTHDPSSDPDGRRIHSQTVEQVAYVVWAWPVLKQWLPQSFYDQCRDFCFKHWAPSLEVSKWWDAKTYAKVDPTNKNRMAGYLHPFKGRHAPGHSIAPNLMMYEVAKREGRKDAKIYLDAAVKQTEWIIKNLDWNDPRTTKGHRMSEHRTITNLVWMLQKYPEAAPKGLKEKITEWAKVAVSRSSNMWDYRRFDMKDHWTIPKLNDVGNSLSVPAITIAASWVVDDPKLKKRLEQIAIASVDHVFGRNPRLAAAPADPSMGFPEVERGWPVHYHKNVCARLETVRGSISSLPGSEMYPFNPEGKYRHREGWVNYGASWCFSLAYLQFDRTGKMSPSVSAVKSAVKSTSNTTSKTTAKKPLADRITYQGIAINNPKITTWGASPIKDEKGIYHLYNARWPSSMRVTPGWMTHSSLGHFTSKSPLGPFKFEKSVIEGTGKDGSWEKYAPHNPLVKKFGDTYVLIYIGRTAPTIKQAPRAGASQRIGIATSKSPYGPWKRYDKPILEPSSDPQNWTYKSRCGVNNPALLQMPNGKFHLYFKAIKKDGPRKTKMGLAIADKVEGPYVIEKNPVTSNNVSIEDGYVFLDKEGMVNFITTDNHGIIEKGGGLLWKSKDGKTFGKPTLAYHRLDTYIKKSDYPNARKIYGSGIWKLERPQILVEDGVPKYLYAPSGISLDGDAGTESHVLKIN